MSSIPDEILTVTEAGKPRELLMSFGLLHELLVAVGDIPTVSTLAIDPELRAGILNTVFALRNEVGVITSPITMFTLRVSSADVQRVMQWVADHVLDFFLTAIETNVKVHLDQADRLKNSMASSVGSAN